MISHEVIVNLIGSTTTKSGLTISAELDTNLYPKGIRVSDDELEMVNLTRASFHGEWNYTIDKKLFRLKLGKPLGNFLVEPIANQ